jgi:hypothetical protein
MIKHKMHDLENIVYKSQRDLDENDCIMYSNQINIEHGLNITSNDKRTRSDGEEECSNQINKKVKTTSVFVKKKEKQKYFDTSVVCCSFKKSCKDRQFRATINDIAVIMNKVSLEAHMLLNYHYLRLLENKLELPALSQTFIRHVITCVCSINKPIKLVKKQKGSEEKNENTNQQASEDEQDVNVDMVDEEEQEKNQNEEKKQKNKQKQIQDIKCLEETIEQY